MYAKILVGFDDSPPSRAALIEAAHWAKRHGGSISLVHAVFFDTEEFGIAPEQHEKRVQNGVRFCTRARDLYSAEFGIEISSQVREGDPHEAILAATSSNGADLVVLGTFGRKGLNRLIMGSVTSQVIVHSPVDVLVVNKQCTECTGTYRTILVPFEGSAPSRKALERACMIAKADGGTVTALYVIPRYEEMVGFLKTEGIRERMYDQAGRIVDSAVALGRNAGIDVTPEIRDGHAGMTIIDEARKVTDGLIVMGSHGYRGIEKAILGSTAERVIVDAPCPVLVAR